MSNIVISCSLDPRVRALSIRLLGLPGLAQLRRNLRLQRLVLGLELLQGFKIATGRSLLRRQVLVRVVAVCDTTKVPE